MEKEFVAGYLFGQGFISSAREIKSMNIESDGAKVALAGETPTPVKASYRIVSGGGKTACVDGPARPSRTESTASSAAVA